MNHTPAYCCDHSSDQYLSVDVALENILTSVHALTTQEYVDIRHSLGRTLATTLTAPFAVPPHRNSAMDGYAIQLNDTLNHQTISCLDIMGTAFAGKPYQGYVKAGQCIRIMTGAVVPSDCDTVIMQEHVKRDKQQITFEAQQHRQGQNIRHIGEDMQCGADVLQAGRKINSADLGLLASLGIAEIAVIRKPKVVFFSTGDELKGIGETLALGDIYDSNRYTLFALLQQLDVDLIDMGVIPDQREAVENAFQQASQLGDVLISSGGVSVGDADFVTETLEKMGQVGFWKIAMKPGKPLAFGHLNGCTFFGLPGNPVSVMATFAIFVRPALQKIKGLNDICPTQWTAICDSTLKKAVGRADYQRGIYYQGDDGKTHVNTTGLQGSHMLSSMSQANCFIVLARESGDIAIGQEVAIYPFEGLF